MIDPNPIHVLQFDTNLFVVYDGEVPMRPFSDLQSANDYAEQYQVTQTPIREEWQLDLQGVKSRVEEEGLGYFLLHYTSANSMPTPELRRAFFEAADAMRRFKALVDQIPSEESSDD